MKIDNIMVLSEVHVAITWEKSNKTVAVLKFINILFQICDKKLLQ